jgi:hypothetical protein
VSYARNEAVGPDGPAAFALAHAKQAASFLYGRVALGLWGRGGGGFFNTDGVGPFGDEGVSFFHGHPGILHEHLWASAATPGEIAEEVLPTDAVCAGWGIDPRLATFDETGQIVHSTLRFRIHSMQDGRAEYQSGSGACPTGSELDASTPFR